MMRARNAVVLFGFLGAFSLSTAGAAAQWEEDEDLDGSSEAEAGAELDAPTGNPEEGDDWVPADANDSATAAGGESPVQVTVGAKIGIGGNYLPSPDNTGFVSTPFDDGVGGIGFGGGFFGEARVLDGLLGLELGFIFDSSTNWSKYTLNNTDFEPGWTAVDLRMPVLLNVGTPGGGTRVTFGTGPEFAFPLSASTEITGPVNTQGIARTETHVNWLLNLGLAVPVGPVKVSFDIRFAYNLAVPSEYAERAQIALPASYTVLTQHQMDLRLLLGVGYDLPL